MIKTSNNAYKNAKYLLVSICVKFCVGWNSYIAKQNAIENYYIFENIYINNYLLINKLNKL